MKNNKRRAIFSLILGALCMVSAAVNAQTYVGSFAVDDGPDWQTNPPVYSGQQAAALIFGGSPSDYAISTNSNTTDPGTITNTAWYDGWGLDCTEFNQSYSFDLAPAGYQFPGGDASSWSAYVSDHDCAEVNYVWRVKATAQVPTMTPWALLVLAGLTLVVGIRRLRPSV